MTSIPDITQAQAAQRNGQLAQAAQLAAQITRAQPQAAEAWRVWAECALAGGAFTEAIGVLDQALAQAATDPEVRARFLIEKAFACAQVGRNAEAAGAAEMGLAFDIRDGVLATRLGIALMVIGLYQKARAPLAYAARCHPQDGDLQNILGDCERILGQGESAEASFLSGLAAGSAAAAYSLAWLKRWRADDTHIQTYLSWRPGQPLDAARIGYALFKEFDDLGRHDEAWAWLSRAGAVRKPLGGWTNAAEIATVEAWEHHFPPGLFEEKAAPPQGRKPRRIFIVGLPRSGTTLVERILAAHPRVVALGESQAFGLAVKRLSMVKSRQLLDPAVIAAAASLDRDAVAERYETETAYLHDGTADFVIDKLPHNHEYAGLIRRVFPDAIIIHVRRNPMDSLFGAYKRLFADAHGWSYGLDDLADHYANYCRLMGHWSQCLGASLVDLSLEALVADPDTQIRSLLSRCGIAFDARCLAPHEAKGPIMSASAVQVRRPINADGIDSWRSYAQPLEPLRQRLLQRGLMA